MIGRGGSIVWLVVAALALLYLMALALYAALKTLSPPKTDIFTSSPASGAAPPAPPLAGPHGEITESLRLQDAAQSSAVETGFAAAGFNSLIGGRKYQEDSMHVGVTRAGALMAVVCDGMGGLKGGAQASALAVNRLFSYAQELTDEDDIPEALRQAALDADADVAGLREAQGGKSGTTAVAVLVLGGSAYWLSVGDSRIYVLRGRRLHRITRDHNLELELRYAVEAGDITPQEAMRAERPDALISYLGMGGVTLVDTGRIDMERSDVILLCSDGLFKALSEQEIAQMLDSLGANVAGCADALTVSAVRRGGTRQDNTTAVVIRPLRL